MPWIPTDEQWRALLEVAAGESLRNRLMLALAYDAALRREELCLLATDDLDPAHRTLRGAGGDDEDAARAGRALLGGRRPAAGRLSGAPPVDHRARGALFVSESPRNRGGGDLAVDVVEGGARRSRSARACRRLARTRCGICA